MKEYKNAQALALSACLISEVAVTKVIEKLTIDNFSEPELRNIFKAINSLFSKNTKIDILTLSSEIKKLGMEVSESWLYKDFEDAVYSDDHIDEHIDLISKYTLMNNVKKLTAKINNKVGANEPIEILLILQLKVL